MIKKRTLGLLVSIALLAMGFLFVTQPKQNSIVKEAEEHAILEYVCEPGQVEMYWKDDSGSLISSLGNLAQILGKQGKILDFAMNGGMYEKDQSPKGLYIQNSIVLKNIDTATKGYGNFYIQPNGVFSIGKNNQAEISTSAEAIEKRVLKFATQSGPLLLVRGAINDKLIPGSTNLNIRNGVGILPNGMVIFAMSKKEINFYDFAMFFKQKGCANALYLDGFVSRTYLPAANWIQKDGKFGVLIGVAH